LAKPFFVLRHFYLHHLYALADYPLISEVYRQQQWMYDHRSRRIDHRIVSISQPHVRPIKRGKAGSEIEFGAKLSLSLITAMLR